MPVEYNSTPVTLSLLDHSIMDFLSGRVGERYWGTVNVITGRVHLQAGLANPPLPDPVPGFLRPVINPPGGNQGGHWGAAMYSENGPASIRANNLGGFSLTKGAHGVMNATFRSSLNNDAFRNPPPGTDNESGRMMPPSWVRALETLLTGVFG